MNKKPYVSVVIPVFNAEEYLCQCLESVINQTLKEIEIICIDDKSTDSSLDILEKYAKKDKRITIIRNELNLKAGESRNRGLRIASGEYIHFLDADDYMVNDAYEVLYNKAKSYDLDLLKAKAYGIDDTTLEPLNNPLYHLSNLDENDFNTVTNFFENLKNLQEYQLLLGTESIKEFF